MHWLVRGSSCQSSLRWGHDGYVGLGGQLQAFSTAADVLEESDMGGYSVYFHGLLPARMSVSRGYHFWTCWGEEDRAWLYSYFLRGELL